MVQPNILITGTPGVGKSKLCKEISKKYNLKWQDVSKIAMKNGFVEEYDEKLDCPVLHEDDLLDFLESELSKGGNIVEYHGCDFFPERWFDAVFVVRCNNTILYDRLAAREYNSTKITKNIECEIFQLLLNEAKDCYDEEIVFELSGDTENDFENSVKQISEFLDKRIE